MSDHTAETKNFDLKKMGFLFLGVAIFAVVYWSPAWSDAVDPMGKHFALTREAKGALAVFLLAGTWCPSESPAWPSASCRRFF